MEKLTKSQLQKIWEQLDGACEAIEKLNARGGFSIDVYGGEADISDLIILKERVESEIEKFSLDQINWRERIVTGKVKEGKKRSRK